ncbi:hypothetical protein QMK61_15980 [Fulvimonas sp. R45]|uniref:hypothetical protein n=1 Tax=Fulvimonas sp. R45 TaxID=3045937 RepID=UPI00265F1D6F|nr:hypothetical protein [Fulvimonas sp. R45]MDO1530337.1 hypothetical protein [Fulvimonas sp. R45]
MSAEAAHRFGVNELLFLDTEWANDRRDLVSLALVNVDGSRVLYLERDPLPSQPSAFVLSVVYPLLDRSSALPDHQFTDTLRAYVAASGVPHIHFDSQWDKVLLGQALSEWGRNLTGIPEFVSVLIERNDVRDEVEVYFKNNPEALARRHHALVDAEALRHAFVEVVDP